MSTKSLSSVLAISFALVLLLAKTNGNPIDATEEAEIFVCPEGGTTNCKTFVRSQLRNFQ